MIVFLRVEYFIRKGVIVRETERRARTSQGSYRFAFSSDAVSARSQDESTGDFAFSQQIKSLIGLGKRPRRHLATHFTGGSQSENFPQVLSRADRSRPDAHFSGGHQNRRETTTRSVPVGRTQEKAVS
jgi:hypothetical protein